MMRTLIIFLFFFIVSGVVVYSQPTLVKSFTLNQAIQQVYIPSDGDWTKAIYILQKKQPIEVNEEIGIDGGEGLMEKPKYRPNVRLYEKDPYIIRMPSTKQYTLKKDEYVLGMISSHIYTLVNFSNYDTAIVRHYSLSETALTLKDTLLINTKLLGSTYFTVHGSLLYQRSYYGNETNDFMIRSYSTNLVPAQSWWTGKSSGCSDIRYVSPDTLAITTVRSQDKVIIYTMVNPQTGRIHFEKEFTQPLKPSGYDLKFLNVQDGYVIAFNQYDARKAWLVKYSLDGKEVWRKEVGDYKEGYVYLDTKNELISVFADHSKNFDFSFDYLLVAYNSSTGEVKKEINLNELVEKQFATTTKTPGWKMSLYFYAAKDPAGKRIYFKANIYNPGIANSEVTYVFCYDGNLVTLLATDKNAFNDWNIEPLKNNMILITVDEKVYLYKV